MMDSFAKEGEVLGAGWLPLASPEFQRGWRRFCANVLRESLQSAAYVGRFALRHEYEAKSKFQKRVEDAVNGGCAAWLWIAGQGNKDFSFSEVCEVCDLDPHAVRESFLDLFGSGEDIKKADRWVLRRCELTGCLWAEEGGDED